MQGEKATQTLFRAVLRQLIENFTPKITQKLSEYEFLKGTVGKTEALKSTLRSFPSSSKEYIYLITSLNQMADSEPLLVLQDILDFGRELGPANKSGRLMAILSLLPLYNHSVVEHQMFLYHTWLYFTSDLVMRIVQKHKVEPLHEDILSLLLKFENEDREMAPLFDQILDLWAVTIAAIGNNGGIGVVTRAFETIVDQGKMIDAIRLVQYITLKKDGFDEFKEAVIRSLKERNESFDENELTFIYKLLVGCQKDEKFLNDIMECLKNDITIETIVKMTLDGGITAEYVKERIMGGENPSVRALIVTMTGINVPKEDIYQQSFNIDVISRCLKQGLDQWDDGTLIINGFMEHFFEKASRGRDKWIYVFVLIALAIRHFDEFTERIVPPFLELETSDARVVLLLMTLKELNAMEGLFAGSQLKKLNDLAAPAIRKWLSIFPQQIPEKAIVVERQDELLGPVINDNTQAIALFLDSINNDIFKDTPCSFISARPPDSKFGFEFLIVKASGYVLSEAEMLDLFDFWLELSCHPCAGVAETVFGFCSSMVEKHPSKLIPTLIRTVIETESDEKLLHIIKLVHLIATKCSKLNEQELVDLEFIAMVSSVTIHPEVRIFALRVMELVAVYLKNKSIYTILKDNKKALENTIRRRIMLASAAVRSLESGKPIAQTGEIGVRLVCGSYYYDIWLLVLSEIMSVLIAVNCLPILELLEVRLGSSRNFRCLFLFAASAYYYPVFDSLVCPYPLCEEGRPEPSDEMQVKLFQILVNLIENDRTEHALRIIQGVHFSFCATVTQVLPCVREDFIPEATGTLVVFLRSPEITPVFIESMLVFVLQFVQVVQNYLVLHDLNGPRVISWDSEREKRLLEHETTILNYILVIVKALPDSHVSEDEWPMAARDLTFRFMLNWALTKDPKLSRIRDYAMNGIVTISKVGAIFSDSLLFDRKVVKLFGKYERRGFSFVQCLLFYHADLLMEIFILAYFCQPRRIADCYLESLLILTGSSHANLVYQASGQFLLLLFVLRIRQHILADELLDFFLRTVITKNRKFKLTYSQILKRFETEPDFMVITECFSYATEAVFDFAFTLLGMKLHVSVNDICDALVPWIANLRLLPKRSQCANDVTGSFNCFTPYQFLMKFMEMSGVVKDDEFLNVTTLWTELMRSPDHVDLIPLFFMSWPEAALKKKIFDLLLRNDPVAIVKRLAQHCTFAYHYYVTCCLDKSFKDELWVLDVIFEGFHRHWTDVAEEVITVIHFAYLFRYNETTALFDLICNKLEVDTDDDENLVKKICEKFENSEEWGNEALKWVVGSKSTRHVSVSLQVYNQIQKPALEPALLAKVVLYHIDHSPTEVSDLIMESFVFFANNFTGNENFAADFLISFLESPIYCSAYSGLLLKVLSSSVTGRKTWPMIIQMVKPMLGRLEGNESLARMFDLFIRTSHNEELMLIIAPMKDLEPSLFPSSPDTNKLMTTVGESTMCKCLAHYANMINTVSVRLVNAIFRVATLILDKVPSHENNMTHLAKLYTFALHTLSQCPNAIPLITLIMMKEPSVAVTSYMDMMESERTIEDVERSLERLAKKNDELFVLVITDCKSHTNVVGFPDMTTKPKILPFVTHQDMIDGMLRVTKSANIRKTLSLRKLNAIPTASNAVIRSTVMSISNLINNTIADVNTGEMIHPKNLAVYEIKDPISDASVDFIYTPSQFLSALTL